MESLVKAEFPNRLKFLRKAIGATQEEMAHRLGITRQSLSLYEKGDRLPDIEILEKILSETGCSIDFLMGYSDSMSERLTDTVMRTEIDESAIMCLEDHWEYSELLSALFANDKFWNLIHRISLYSRKNDEEISRYAVFLCHDALSDLLATLRGGLRFDSLLSRIEDSTFSYVKRTSTLSDIATENNPELASRIKKWNEEADALVKEEEEKAKTDKFVRFRLSLVRNKSQDEGEKHE